MALNDILLHLDSYPDPTSTKSIDQAVSFAAQVGAKLTALAVHVKISLHRHWIAEQLVGLSVWAQEEEARSLANCRAALAVFSAKAAQAGVLQDALIEQADLYLAGEHLSQRARTRDLCIVPLDSAGDRGEVAQSVIFGSGRPVLLLGADRPSWLGTVVLAWDGSRAAARAMGDAMPVLEKAKAVRVVTIVNKDEDPTEGLGHDAARHLRAHGVDPVVEDVEAGGRRVGPALDDYLAQHQADLLVMGAYGHSRLREFVLGGATEHVLRTPGLAVLLSH
jgi:nucleotide-binding universal stress UspA family protein